jgi:hypothetical protein
MHSSSNTSALGRDTSHGMALWNPVVAAGWSVVFTPAFGAWLVMRNWEALGDRRQAELSRKWFVFSIGLLAVRLLSSAINTRLNSQSNLLLWFSWGYLVVWWLAAAAPQARAVRARYGADFPRHGWDYAMLLALAGGIGYQLVSGILTWLFVALT